jgi:hypothetical protein
MEGGLWGIIVKEDEDEALVTLPSEKYIQVVQLVVSTNAVVNLHLKPTVGRQISTLIFDFFYGGGLYKYSMKNILRTAKFLTTWGLDQMYCPGL